MTKGLISIFALPYEIDNLHLTLYNLRRNAELLSTDIEYGFDITLCLSDEMTDWKSSKLPKQYFIDKFDQIANTLCNWAIPESITIEHGHDILGCVSQRNHSLQFLDKYDFTLWMDNDLFFNDKFLSYLGASVKAIQANGIEYFIVTPQVTRQWDDSWDVLVNKKLLSRPLHDNLTADVFSLGLIDSTITVTPINTFKAAGGWGTAISNKLLKITGIPEKLGHYGLEDTYVLSCAMQLRSYRPEITPQQFVLDGMLVCENHSQQTTEYLRTMIASIDRKDEFRQVAAHNYQPELQRFYNENILPYFRVQ